MFTVTVQIVNLLLGNLQVMTVCASGEVGLQAMYIWAMEQAERGEVYCWSVQHSRAAGRLGHI
jgi:hypothetical protein